MKLIVNWLTVVNNDLWKGNKGTRNRVFGPSHNMLLLHRTEKKSKTYLKTKQKTLNRLLFKI